MTLGNRGNTHGFHEFQFHDFSPSNKFASPNGREFTENSGWVPLGRSKNLSSQGK